MADKLIKADKKDDAINSLSIVTDSLNKLEILVQDILALTETKNAVEENQLVNIEEIIEDAQAKLTHMENYERLKIEKEITGGQLVKVKKSRLVLIIENLISNAIKYQDIEKQRSFIHIKSYIHNKQLHLSVEDNGIGIPQDKQTQLFMMFKRFHAKTSFGSGLGLYMVDKSATVLGGKITYKDTGSGSRFTLIIPI